jgi:hypothetical protein
MAAFLKKERQLGKKKRAPIILSPLQKQLVLGFLLLLGVVLILTSVWYFTRIESLQIKRIEVIGGETIPHALIEEKANIALSGTYFALIPKRFLPLYPQEEVMQSVRTIARVKNVQVTRAPENTLSIVFDEYIPAALWCESKDATPCLFMDRSGYAFAQAPSLEGSAFVRYVSDEHAPEVGQTGFDSSFMKDTGLFTTLLEENLSLYATHVEKMGNYDVWYTISGGGLIKVSQSIPMEESFKNLQTILLSEEFKHIEPGSFQYIDLRFGEKIFVNEATGETGSTTATTSNPL